MTSAQPTPPEPDGGDDSVVPEPDGGDELIAEPDGGDELIAEPDGGDELIAAAQAVDKALAATESWSAEQVAAVGELKAAIEAFHEPVLRKFVEAMRADPDAKQILFELVDDPHVFAVLALHGIIKPPPETAPDDTRSGAAGENTVTTIIPIESITVRSRVRRGWTPGPLASEIAEGETFRFDVNEADRVIGVLFTRVDGTISAFNNACPHMGLTLDGPPVTDGAITCPWHGRVFDATTGAGRADPAECLERYRCRVDGDRVWFKVET